MLSRFTQSKWRWAVLGLALVLAAVFGVMALTRGGDRAEAQPIQAHGASIAKNCSSPKRVGATVDCILVVGYNDDFGDDVSILQAWDVQDFGGDNVRVPAAGNLPILAVSGNTTCVAGGSLPCSIGRDPGTGGKGPNAGQVTFRDNTYVIQANDPRPLPDQGNVDVQDQCNGTPDPGCLPPPAVNRLQFTAQTIVITVSTELTKTASPTSGRAPLSVTYTYTERNTGTSPIRDVRLTDDLCSPVTGPTGGDTNGNGILDPGEAWTFTCSKTYDTCPSPIITNHVVATGTASDGLPAPEERAQTDVQCFTVSTELTKTANPTSGRAPLAVTYTYTERNTGTSPIRDVRLTDDLCSPVTGPTGGDTNGNGILDPGEAWTFTCSKTYNTCPSPTITNHVVATGTASDGLPAPEERAQTDVQCFTVSTELTKTASPTSGRAPLAVTYTYTERNTGTSPIRDVRLTDDLCSPVTGPTGGDANGNGILDPGEAWTFTCSKMYDTCPSPIITNHAIATGTSTLDGRPAPEERAQTDVQCFPVSTELSKTASPTSGRAPLAVTYTYTERNTGASPIRDVRLTDDLCSPVTGPTGGDTNGNGILDPGEAWTFTCSKTYDTCPSPVITNHVVATGTSTLDGRPAPEERAQTDVQCFTVSTELTKTASPTSGPAPLPVTYTYTERNTGTSPISGVSLSDDLCSPVTGPTGGDTNGNGILDPGEAWTFTCSQTFTAAGTYVNNVVATGTSTLDGRPAPEERARAEVTVTGGQGCTPGFWKTHTDATRYPNAWPPTGYVPGQPVTSVFIVPAGYASYLGSSSLAQALAFQGGSTLDGAAEILLRAAVAAVLNSTHPAISYPRTVAGIVADVNAALASRDRGTILRLASALDADNNLGCPISGR
jgi:uncharacterized repeat protein (TIGR01451 family)